MTATAACWFRAAFTVLVMGALTLALAGCNAGPTVDAVVKTLGPNIFDAGASVEGRPIECHVLGEGPENIFIIASIHGDETAGTPLVRKLSHYLQMNPHRLRGKRVILLPAVNPDGMVNGTRANANGVDLNRNFPGPSRENSDSYGWVELSEPEAQAIASLAQLYWPSRIVAIHQPLACVDFDGPAEILADTLGHLSKLPVKRLGTRPGSMGGFFGEALGVPTITLELPRDVHRWNEARLWEIYGDAMVASVVFPESVDSVLVKHPPKRGAVFTSELKRPETGK